VGALIAVAVIDRRDVDWNWTVLSDIVGGLALGTAALIGAIGGIRALDQRTEADQRAEWWKRAEKVSDYLVSGDADKIDLGSRMLDALLEDDRRTGNREWRYVYAIAVAATLDEDVEEGDNDHNEGGSNAQQEGA